MARNRTIYASEALFAGPAGSTGAMFDGLAGTGGSNLLTGLHRIQDISYAMSIPRVDVNQFSELAYIDRVILDQPTVSLGFSWLQAGLNNEKILGFTISSGTLVSAVSGFLNKNTDDRNYFIRTSAEGKDAVNDSTKTQSAFGFGNGFITSYSAEGAVNSFPRCSVGVEALNIQFYNQTSGYSPAIFPSNGSPVSDWRFDIPVALSSPVHLSGISVLRPGDITLGFGSFNDGGADVNDIKIQSYSISFDLGRDALMKLGSKYAYSREIRFPVPVTLSVSAIVGDMTTGSLVNYISNNSDYDLYVNINRPGTSTTAVRYDLKQANLESQDFSSSIGDNKQVTLTFATQIGSASQNTIGLFMSGIN